VIKGFRKEESPVKGMVGDIPVANIWLLLLYASELFRYLGEAPVHAEENPEKIADLVAEILAHLVEMRLRRNLSYGYLQYETILSRVRGRIDLITTQRRDLLLQGKIACRYEDLTVDTPRNRYVLAALRLAALLVQRADLARHCRRLALALSRLGVKDHKPSREAILRIRFGHHDAADQQMLAAAHLFFQLRLPTETAGSRALLSPDRNEQWLRKLYERAVAGFYKVVLFPSGWRVYPSRILKWQIEKQSAGVSAVLPTMRADMILHSPDGKQRIVIDTKFNRILTPGWHRDETLRSGYLYQIYAYLRSQEKVDDPASLNSMGLLLHPAVSSRVDEWVVIQGHKLRFATVDLAAPAREIRTRLLEVINATTTEAVPELHH